MKTEAITWRELPADGMPDAEITVLAEIEYPDPAGETETWPAWWSGEHWIEAATGDHLEIVGRRVVAWSDMPGGSRTC